MPDRATPASRRYAPWLWLLLGLFVVRVVAQPLALIAPGGWLPAFEDWQSGAVPYPFLVVMQALIILSLWRTAARFSNGQVVPRRRLGAIMLALGAIYFFTMVARLVLGATLLDGRRWFESPIPAAFHLILAVAFILYGHFHFRHGS